MVGGVGFAAGAGRVVLVPSVLPWCSWSVLDPGVGQLWPGSSWGVGGAAGGLGVVVGGCVVGGGVRCFVLWCRLVMLRLVVGVGCWARQCSLACGGVVVLECRRWWRGVWWLLTCPGWGS